MATYRDLTGQKFGKLTVLERSNREEDKNKKSIVWKCQCDCGNIKYASSDNLTRGRSKSCGCLKKNDRVGMRFGKLTVIADTGKRDEKRRVVWMCQCDCGEMIEVNSDYLTNKGSQIISCGKCSPKWSGRRTDS